MLRSIIAIVVGFVVIGVLAFGTDMLVKGAMPGAFDPVTGATSDVTMLVFALVYVFVFATFGCWLAGRLAPSQPMKHAMILGVLGLVFNVVGTYATWATAPAWYHVTALLLVMPAAYLGGLLASRTRAGALATA